MSYFPLFALTAGAAIAVQATLNAQLGVLLKNPLAGTLIAFLMAGIFTALVLLISPKPLPVLNDAKSVPLYLWIAGGGLSAFGVGMFYYLIPRMGVGTMMSFALSGQMVVAAIASHYGWFDLPHKPITAVKMVGIITLLTGCFLINWSPRHGFA